MHLKGKRERGGGERGKERGEEEKEIKRRSEGRGVMGTCREGEKENV